MYALIALVVASSGSFPLPTVDGKPLAVTDKQKTFRLPMHFEKVRAFYEAQLKGVEGVTLKVTGPAGERVLSLSNHRKTDAWTAAKVIEKELETVVEVTPVLQMTAADIEGHPPRPLVEFIIGRSADVDRAVTEGIDRDHLEKVRQ